MRKGIIVFSVTLSLLAVWGCSKFKAASFVAPTWDTQFSAPLFDRTYTLGEILHKDSVTTVGGDTTFLYTTPPLSVFSISRTQAIAGIPVGANLQIGSVPPVTASKGLGEFTIDSPDSINYTVPYPNGASPGAKVPQVPAIPGQSVTQSPNGQFLMYRSATISQGELHVTVHNGYPATVQFDSGSINILDASGRPLPLHVNSVGANQTFDTTYSLSGYTLTNNPSIHFVYSSPGLNDTATFQSSSLLSIFMGFTTLTVSSASAIIPPQPTIHLDQAIQMAGGTQVASANIRSGGLDLTLTNGFEMQLPITLVFKDILKQNNPTDTLKLNYTLPANVPGQTLVSVAEPRIDLSGYQLRTLDQYGNLSDSLHYRVEVGIPGSNGQFVDVSTQNSISATFSLEGLTFSSFTGVIHPKNVFTFATDTQRIDIGDFKSKLKGGITLIGDSTKLDLKIRSAGFPYLVHINLKPMNSASPTLSVDSVDTTVIIRPNQTNIVGIGASFVKALNDFAAREQEIPDEFIISGSALVNPLPSDVPFPYSGGNAVGTIADTDKISITNTISMPLYVGIINASFIDTTKKPVFDSSTSAKMSEVDSGDVHFDVTNGLPLQLTFVPQLIDTTDGSITTLDSIIVASPNQFDANGIVTEPIFSPNRIKLTGSQAKKFSSSFMKFNFSVITPRGAQPVPFASNNTIRLKVYASLAFKVDKNLTGGK